MGAHRYIFAKCNLPFNAKFLALTVARDNLPLSTCTAVTSSIRDEYGRRDVKQRPKCYCWVPTMLSPSRQLRSGLSFAPVSYLISDAISPSNSYRCSGNRSVF